MYPSRRVKIEEMDTKAANKLPIFGTIALLQSIYERDKVFSTERSSPFIIFETVNCVN